jgi:DNA-binding MarR family transcriptional regulator
MKRPPSGLRPAMVPSSDVDWPLDPVLDFMRLLWEIEHVLQRASKRMARSLDVTGPQRLVLRIVDRCPGIAPGALAEIVRLHPSTLTGVLRRLERKRLLARRVDSRDRRRAQLSIRPGARRLTHAEEGTVEAVVKRVLAAESRSAIQQTRQVLARLAQALGNLSTSAPGSRLIYPARQQVR